MHMFIIFLAQQYVNAQDCCHAQAYWHSNDQAQLFLHGGRCPPWKPPSYPMDAPPPYTEADAQRAELVAAASSSGTSADFVASALRSSFSGPSHDNGSPDTGHFRVGHARNDSLGEASARLTANEEAGPSRDHHSVPARLGPLAVQLLPSGPTNSEELRDQIQRQRLSLTAHTTRTLPRPASLQPSAGDCAGRANSGHTLPRIASPGSAGDCADELADESCHMRRTADMPRQTEGNHKEESDGQSANVRWVFVTT